MTIPLTLAMFNPHVPGDHHLLELMQRRFTEMNLGAEFYPTSLYNLQQLLEFRPWSRWQYTLHLPRNLGLLSESDRNHILDIASRERTDAYGLIIHDQPEMATQPYDYVEAIKTINHALLKLTPRPYLFIEYAVGLEVAEFLAIFQAAQSCEQVSACIDISHVGIRQVGQAYEQLHPGESVFRFTPTHPQLPVYIDDVVTATATALPTVLQLIRGLAELGKPLHFHLHDGHPLSTFSPYRISDHLSFYQDIQLPFEYQNQTTVPLMFQPSGLQQIVSLALDLLPVEKLSFMLEIHPIYNRLPLGTYAHLFGNWKDVQNAEQINGWLDLIHQNWQLLNEVYSR